MQRLPSSQCSAVVTVLAAPPPVTSEGSAHALCWLLDLVTMIVAPTLSLRVRIVRMRIQTQITAQMPHPLITRTWHGMTLLQLPLAANVHER
jgi:hypothetical protein